MKLGPMWATTAGARQGLTVLIVGAAIAVTAGCTGASKHDASTGSPKSVATSPAGSGGQNVSTHASTGAQVDSRSPLVVASVAVAKRSREQVTQLHALSVAAGRPGGIPSAQIPASAKTLNSQLQAEIRSATLLKPPAGTSAANLVGSLNSYVHLATQLTAWNAKAPKPLSTAYFATLKTTDAQWQAALKSLGSSTKTDLLAGMAPLLYPS